MKQDRLMTHPCTVEIGLDGMHLDETLVGVVRQCCRLCERALARRLGWTVDLRRLGQLGELEVEVTARLHGAESHAVRARGSDGIRTVREAFQLLHRRVAAGATTRQNDRSGEEAWDLAGRLRAEAADVDVERAGDTLEQVPVPATRVAP